MIIKVEFVFVNSLIGFIILLRNILSFKTFLKMLTIIFFSLEVTTDETFYLSCHYNTTLTRIKKTFFFAAV